MVESALLKQAFITPYSFDENTLNQGYTSEAL